MIPDSLQLTRLSFLLQFPPVDFGDKITLSSRLRSAAEGLLDGEPTILPLPANVPNIPAEVPRVQLQARDNSHVLQLCANRLTFQWQPRTPTGNTWNTRSAPYLEGLGKILRVFAGEYAQPQRFVFGPQFVLQIDGSANEYMIGNLLQEGRVQMAPISCNVGIVEQINLDGLVLNLGVTIASARQTQRPERDNVMVIQFELQPPPQIKGPLTAEGITNAVTHIDGFMAHRLRSLLREYFPTED